MLHLTARTSRRLDKLKDKQRANLVEIDKKYSLMNKKSKREVENILENELDYLLGRKEIDKMKKRKMQELEESYEKQRLSRISKIDEKISRSDKNRSQTLREKQTRSKRNLECFDQKIKKIEHENEEELQKMLEAQKDYLKRNSESRSSLHSSRQSQINLQSSRSFNHSLRKNQLEKSLRTIDSRIEKIETRIDQAKTNQKFYHRQKSQRAKCYSKDVQETMSKIHANDTIEETKCIQEYYSRITHIIDCQQKTKSFYQKESERRRKNINEKFQKCNENLKYLKRQREEKLQKISAKFDKIATPKEWRTQRSGKYLLNLAEKRKQIQVQKDLKAECIMSKHLNLSMRNKVLREKKDHIFQTVKKVEF